MKRIESLETLRTNRVTDCQLQCIMDAQDTLLQRFQANTKYRHLESGSSPITPCVVVDWSRCQGLKDENVRLSSAGPPVESQARLNST